MFNVSVFIRTARSTAEVTWQTQTVPTAAEIEAKVFDETEAVVIVSARVTHYLTNQIVFQYTK